MRCRKINVCSTLKINKKDALSEEIDTRFPISRTVHILGAAAGNLTPRGRICRATDAYHQCHTAAEKWEQQLRHPPV